MKQNITRGYELQQGRAEILRLIYQQVKDKADGKWYHYKSKLKASHYWFEIECDFKIADGLFSVENETFKKLNDGIIIY